jgi:hypothetical protein
VPERVPFEGFSLPTYTQVPDELFDRLMPHLTEAELKVLLYIVRRTFGFKKITDDISLSQLVAGITTRDGTLLDEGTGLTRRAVLKALKSLKEQGIIEARRNQSATRGDEATTYALRFRDTPSERNAPRGRERTDPRLGNTVALQQTVVQQTVKQETDFEISKNRNSEKIRKPEDEEPSRPMTLEERLVWQERMEAQERHLRRLRPKPPP